LVLYWDEAPLQPDAQRRLAFTIGLGRLYGAPSKELYVPGGDRLRLFVNGRAIQNQPFIVTAYIKGTATRQTVTVKLPDGLTLADGQRLSQTIPPTAAGYARVFWRVTAARTGRYGLEAALPGVGVAREKVEVRETSIFAD